MGSKPDTPTRVGLSEGLGVRELPPQAPRVETGPTRFGDDWCGVFIRGDSAFHYAMLLRQVLHPNGEDVDAMTGAFARIQLRGLLRILEASDERGHTPNNQAERPTRAATKGDHDQ